MGVLKRTPIRISTMAIVLYAALLVLVAVVRVRIVYVVACNAMFPEGPR